MVGTNLRLFGKSERLPKSGPQTQQFVSTTATNDFATILASSLLHVPILLHPGGQNLPALLGVYTHIDGYNFLVCCGSQVWPKYHQYRVVDTTNIEDQGFLAPKDC